MTALKYLQEIGCDFEITTEEQALNVLIASHRRMRQQHLEELETRVQTPEGKAIVEAIKNMSFEETISTVLKMSESLIEGAKK